jgi:ParB-like chromosome segregation protein Spo0J
MAIETLTHIGQLTPDPKNARKHTPRNVGTIVNALHEVGAARSIVIDENNVILAGNATVEAAGQAGIEKLRVIDADGDEIIAVRRKGLTGRQKTRLALYDNRAAELAQWDGAVLSQIYAEAPDVLEGLWKEPEIVELLSKVDQITHQIIPLLFLPDEVADLEEAWEKIAARFPTEDKFWLARYKDYDRVMNGMAEVQATNRKLKYIHNVLIYLIKFWREHNAE